MVVSWAKSAARAGRLTFVYDDGWRASSNSYPLSLSMPLVITGTKRIALAPLDIGLHVRRRTSWPKTASVRAQ